MKPEPLPPYEAMQRAINQLLTVSGFTPKLGVSHKSAKRISFTLAEISAGLSVSAEEYGPGRLSPNAIEPLMGLDLSKEDADHLNARLNIPKMTEEVRLGLNDEDMPPGSSTQKTFFVRGPE